MREWVKLLNASHQTVRNWMQEIPEGTDPLTTREMLMERAARKAEKGKKQPD